MNELFINNRLCDLGDNTSLPLKWQSNIFSDITKIQGNKSATITVPKTGNNMAIFKVAEIPATGGIMARQKLPARLVVDGVQVFGDGYAVLLTATPTGYEIALTWGVITNYNALAEDDTKLNEADWWQYTTSSLDGAVLLMNSPDATLTDTQTDWRYLNYFTEVAPGGNDNVPPFLPSVLVKFLLDNIATHYGVTLDIPAARKSYLENLAVLLTSANVAAGDEMLHASLSLEQATFNDVVSADRQVMYMPNNVPSFNYDCSFSTDLTLRYSQEFRIDVEFHNDIAYFRAVSTYDSESGDWVAHLVIDEEEADAGDYIYVRVLKESDDTNIFYNDVVTFDITTDAVARMGYYMYCTPNLPSMTAMEFIKEMALLAGVFAVDANDGTLRFTSAENLLTATPTVLPDPSEVQTVKFTFGDYAQENTLQYTEDDGSPKDGKGVITVNDGTIPITKELFKSHFGLLYDNTHLHLYEKDEDATDWDYRNITQRLAQITAPGTDAVDAYLDFPWVIANHLRVYAATMYEPVVVKCVTTMTLIEVVNIDMAQPVYIKSLGRRYAVLSIEQTAHDKYTFELIQLPI